MASIRRGRERERQRETEAERQGQRERERRRELIMLDSCTPFSVTTIKKKEKKSGFLYSTEILEEHYRVAAL